MNTMDAADILVPVIFVIVAGIIVFRLVKALLEWYANNQKPVERVKAKVTGKREHTRRRSSGNPGRGSGVSIGPSRYRTTYYTTFQLEDDSRVEFKVGSDVYSMLSEGDVGHLTKQGTRFHDFERVGEDS